MRANQQEAAIDVRTERLANQAAATDLLASQRVSTIVQSFPATSGPVSAHYLTTQAEASLSNEVSLASLSSGLLAHNVSGGVSTPVGRTLTPASASIVITNGTGVAGNPTVDTAQNIQTSAIPTFLGVKITQVVPAQITSTQNNYDPGTGEFFLLSSDAARSITGFLAITGGRKYLANIGTKNITLENLDAGSAAANQIITGTGSPVTLAPDDTAILLYDSTTQVWRLFA